MEAFFATLPAFAPAALFNLYFALASIPLGFALAVLLTLARNSGLAPLAIAARVYVYCFRGSPLFIQLFMFYSLALSLNLSLWRPLGIDWLVLHPLFLGPLVLTLNTTAYTFEIFHGALRAVPHGELEAARAFGLSPLARFRTVAWPHMLRLAWPAYTNEVVFLFHATALIYLALPIVSGQRDLMALAKDLFERDFNAYLYFPVAALYFLAVSLAIFFAFGLVYRRLTRHMPGAVPLRFAPRWMR